MNDNQVQLRALRTLLAGLHEMRLSAECAPNPRRLATEAMALLDPESKTPVLVYRAAHRHLVEIARRVSRRAADDAA